MSEPDSYFVCPSCKSGFAEKPKGLCPACGSPLDDDLTGLEDPAEDPAVEESIEASDDAAPPPLEPHHHRSHKRSRR